MSSSVQKKYKPSPEEANPLHPVHDYPPLLPLDVIDADPVSLNDPDQSFLAQLVLAMRALDLDLAIQHAVLHLDKNKKNPAVLNLIGALYLQKRDDKNADKYLTQAARYSTADAKIINNQACVHLLRGAYRTAELLLTGGKRVIKGSFAEYDYNLALALGMQAKSVDAEFALNQALLQEPLIEGYILRARLSYSTGDVPAVEKNLLEGLHHFPTAALIQYYLASVHLVKGDLSTALQYASHALDQEPKNRHYAILYAAIMNNISFDGYNQNQIRLITACLENPGANTGLLSQGWHSLFVHCPIWKDACAAGKDFMFQQAGQIIDRLKAEQRLNDPFILLALRYMILKGEQSERVFLALRHAYLDRFINAPEKIDDQDLSLLSALACQCAFTEYAYYESVDEQQKLGALLKTPHDNSSSPTLLLVLCLYRPLLSLMTEDQAMTLHHQPWFEQIVRDQVINRRTELELMANLTQLTPINDDISRAVEQMYLENPYPAWLSTQYRGNVDHLKLAPQKQNRNQMLIAGCGTGHHAIMSSLSFENMQVLAIDLSRRSLAYAKRKTNELKLPHIEYAQADILELGNLNQRFDIVESVGVLHHLADPLEGLRIILNLLKPGGMIKLGFYSEIARTAMIAARKEIARLEYQATPEGIRQFRHDVLSNPDTHPARYLLKNGDFYTISTCRDLVFHIQETRYTLPQIKEMLANHGLEFHRFNLDIPAMSGFKKRFSGEKDTQNLDLWHQYETEFPNTFANMYQFSAIKRNDRK